MDLEQYKKIINRSDVLDHKTLSVTRDILVAAGETRIVLEIDRILKKNSIDRPALHNKISDLETKYYSVDISFGDRFTIVSLLGDKEVGSLGPGYKPTTVASYYAGLLDKWNRE